MNNQAQINGLSNKPKQTKLSGWFWGFILVCFMLCGSATINFILLLSYIGASSSKPSTDNIFNMDQNLTYVMGDKSSKNKVLEISIYGTIMDEPTQNIKKNLILRVKQELEIADSNKDIKAVLLTINSPGGGITATDIIWKDIRNLKMKRKFPIVVFCQDIAASGGYYLASAGDYIMATETSLVGSIGVISQFVEMEKLFNNLGIKWNVITSKRFDGTDSYKDMGSFTRKMTSGERKIFQEIVQEMWSRFVDVVAQGRTGKLTRQEIAKLADGRVYTGSQALKLKLIDGIGYKEDAFNKAKELAKLSSAQLVSCKYKTSYFQELFESAANRKPYPSLRELIGARIPKFMYLWISEN